MKRFFASLLLLVTVQAYAMESNSISKKNLLLVDALGNLDDSMDPETLFIKQCDQKLKRRDSKSKKCGSITDINDDRLQVVQHIKERNEDRKAKETKTTVIIPDEKHTNNGNATITYYVDNNDNVKYFVTAAALNATNLK